MQVYTLYVGYEASQLLSVWAERSRPGHMVYFLLIVYRMHRHSVIIEDIHTNVGDIREPCLCYRLLFPFTYIPRMHVSLLFSGLLTFVPDLASPT